MKNLKRYKLNVLQSPIDYRDLRYETVVAEQDFPKTLDLRSNLFGVRDQGYQGSCAAMSASTCKDWQERLDSEITEYTSPQFIYYNREDRSSEGMYMRDLMKIMKNQGVCLESMHKYGNKKKPTVKAYTAAEDFVIENYAQISTMNGLKAALYRNGPCIIAVPVYNYGPHIWHQEPGQDMLGGHAMTIVGYTEAGYIIRNSWGNAWEGNGHVVFPYEHWGEQWEVWSTVDSERDVDPVPPEPGKKGCLGRIFAIAGLIILPLLLLL